MTSLTAPTDHFVVATANIWLGHMLKVTDGLTPLVGADVILLQEVFISSQSALKAYLEKAGFILVHAASRFGLAIALRESSELRYIASSNQEHRLGKMGKAEKTAVRKISTHSTPWTERGFISCAFVTSQGQKITIATTHPATPVQPRTRHKQIVRLRQILQEYYKDGGLILGGDMNHYPRPKRIDDILCATTNLRRVPLSTEPTWYARGSKQEKFFKAPAFLLRRSIDEFNGQHDSILYRDSNVAFVRVKVVDIQSDHRAIIAMFTWTN